MKKQDDKKSLVDKIWSKIKNNRLLATLIVIGSIVGGLSAFSDSLQKLFSTADNLIPKTQKVNEVNQSELDFTSNYKDYFNSNFQIAHSEESDILNVTNDGVSTDLSIKDSNSRYIKYVLSNIDEQHLINPFNNYLSLLSKGGPITSRDGPAFTFPILQFKTVNNSRNSIFITKAIFKVSSSKSDPFPIISIDDGFEMQLPIDNNGWGKVYKCKVIFRIKPMEEDTKIDTFLNGEANLGDFDDFASVDLSKYFERLGVKTDLVKHNYFAKNDKKLTEDEYEKRKSEARGLFKSGAAKIIGEIFYEGKNISGNISKEKVRFESTVFLDEEGDGAGVPDGLTYDVSLESDRDNYTKSVSIAQAIKPGEFDRFNIKIAASKSSRHQFDLLLVYNDNKHLIFPNILLNYFIPKGFSNFISN